MCKKKKRILSLMLSLLMVCTMMPMPVSAAEVAEPEVKEAVAPEDTVETPEQATGEPAAEVEEPEVKETAAPEDTVETSEQATEEPAAEPVAEPAAETTIGLAKPAVGDGTKENPYKIATADNLYWFAAKVNGTEADGTKNRLACATLVNDITVNANVLDENGDLNGDGSNFSVWTPLGKSLSDSYSGTFDGDGYAIKGLYVNTSTQNVGLVGVNYGTIQNVNVVDSYFKGGDVVGGVCGNNAGSITNCTNSGSVSSTTRSAVYFGDVGGVCGYNGSGGTITNCANSGSVSSTDTAGGINGENNGGSITNCISRGSVVSPTVNKGGVSGCDWTNGITNCYYDNVNCTVGGIAGKDKTGSAEGKTSAKFASGEITWLLNGSTSTPAGGATLAWGQTLSGDNADAYPVLGGAVVYQVDKYESCIVSETKTQGYSNTDEPVFGPHTLTETNKVEATCTTDGTEAYWTCSACQKLFSDELGKNEISEPIVIKATGHTYGEPLWVWERNKTSATAKFTCTVDNHEELLDATITEDPTSHTKTATVSMDGTDYTDTITVEDSGQDSAGDYFVSKNDLMTNFGLKTDDTVGKVIFGQNESGIAQIWKIAGKDAGIAGDNVVLFADSSLGDSPFETERDNTKTYSEGWGCTYPEGTTIEQVNPNHYGASMLRAKLQEYTSDGNTSYFSAEEKARMNQTTIYTNDTYNNTTYATTDYLYAAHGDREASGRPYATVGSNKSESLNSGLRIDIENWVKQFVWLRSPSTGNKANSLEAFQSNMPGGGDIFSQDISYEVQVAPAFDLNLSSVIFASAASAATSTESAALTIASDKTYTLRYVPASGSDLDKASAEINQAGTDVTVTGAKSGMYLVVQNVNGAYAVVVDANTTSVAASDITGANLSNFDNCKVWLESTDADRITTAVMATKEIPTPTYTITVTSSVKGSDETVTVSPIEVKENVKEGKATVIAKEKDGYKFLGWYNAIEGNPGYDISKEALDKNLSYTFDLKSDMSLVAVYEANGSTSVSISGNGFTVTYGTTTTEEQNSSYSNKLQIGTKVTLNASNADGFLYWKNENGKIMSQSASYTFTVTDKTNLTMVTKATAENTAFVEFVSAYNQVIAGGVYSSTSEMLELPTDIPSKVGCDFVKWSMTVDQIKTSISAGEKHITVSPEYKVKEVKYTITQYNAQDGINISETPVTYEDLAPGSTKTLTAETIEGKKFKCWSSDIKGKTVLGTNESYFMQLSSNVTIYAIYVADSETVIKVPTIVMTNKYATTENGINKVSFVATRTVPEGYTLVEQGMLYSKEGSVTDPTDKTFIVGGENIYKYTSSDTAANGVFTMNIKTPTVDTLIYARAYMIVKNNSTGNEEIIYSALDNGKFDMLSNQKNINR
ncbi:MAG: InlB B-repeat-containing protein [Lachnospiraceae bacterium]|nr:InlB B-repeat-containing protein [Lachnospiraceae bacterium]